MDELKKLAKNRNVLLAGIGVAVILILSLLAFLFLNPGSDIKITNLNGSDGPKVGVVDEDKSSESDAVLDAVLGGLKGRIFNSKSVATLKDALKAKNIDIGIVISQGFGNSFSAGNQTTITVIYDPTQTQSSQVNQAVQQVIQNYAQQNGGTIVVQAVIYTPPPDPGAGGTGGTSGTGGSSSGENPTNKPRRVP